MPEEGVEHPGARDSGSFEPLDVGTHIQTHRHKLSVLCQGSQCSYLLSPLCSLFFFNQLIYLRAEETLKAV